MFFLSRWIVLWLYIKISEESAAYMISVEVSSIRKGLVYIRVGGQSYQGINLSGPWERDGRWKHLFTPWKNGRKFSPSARISLDPVFIFGPKKCRFFHYTHFFPLVPWRGLFSIYWYKVPSYFLILIPWVGLATPSGLNLFLSLYKPFTFW
jgi:hypothetical protein